MSNTGKIIIDFEYPWGKRPVKFDKWIVKCQKVVKDKVLGYKLAMDENDPLCYCTTITSTDEYNTEDSIFKSLIENNKEQVVKYNDHCIDVNVNGCTYRFSMTGFLSEKQD